VACSSSASAGGFYPGGVFEQWPGARIFPPELRRDLPSVSDGAAAAPTVGVDAVPRSPFRASHLGTALDFYHSAPRLLRRRLGRPTTPVRHDGRLLAQKPAKVAQVVASAAREAVEHAENQLERERAATVRMMEETSH